MSNQGTKKFSNKDGKSIANYRFSCLECTDEFKTRIQLVKHREFYHLKPSAEIGSSEPILKPQGMQVKVPRRKRRAPSKDATIGTRKSKPVPDKRKDLSESTKKIPKQISRKMQKCLACPMKFRTIKELKSHHQERHADSTKNEVCSYCEKTFPSPRSRLEHEKSHRLHCRFCTKTFENETDLQQHIESHGIDAQKHYSRHACLDCGERFRKLDELRNHHDKSHTSKKKIPCEKCDKQCISSGQYHDHIRSHKIPCRLCRRGFENEADLQQHVASHENDAQKLGVFGAGKRRTGIHTCLDCGERFGKLDELRNHHDKSHTSKKKIPCEKCDKQCISLRESLDHAHNHGRNACRFCKEVFDGYYLLGEHVIKMHADKCVLCQTCGRKFGLKRQLDQHQKTNLNCCKVNQPTKCRKCGVVSENSALHRQHYQSHHRLDKRRFCRICNLSFKAHAEYVTHFKNYHNANIPYTCPIGYRSSTGLMDHISKKMLSCPQCPKLFKTRGGVRKHLISFHKPNIKCDVCPRRFHTTVSKDAHVKARHMKKSPASLRKRVANKCTICDKKFMTRDGRRRHDQTYHKGQFKCGICNVTFVSGLNHQEHILKFHSNIQRNPLLYICNFCFENTKTRDKMVAHVEAEHKDHPDCKKILGILQSQGKIQDAVLDNGRGEQWYCCYVCNKLIKDDYLIEPHVVNFHIAPPVSEDNAAE